MRKAHSFYSANGFTVNRLTNGKKYSFALLAVSTEDVSSDATTVFADNGTCSFVVQNPGTYTITCGEANKDATKQ